jgi:hypothetical protein
MINEQFRSFVGFWFEVEITTLAKQNLRQAEVGVGGW